MNHDDKKVRKNIEKACKAAARMISGIRLGSGYDAVKEYDNKASVLLMELAASNIVKDGHKIAKLEATVDNLQAEVRKLRAELGRLQEEAAQGFDAAAAFKEEGRLSIDLDEDGKPVDAWGERIYAGGEFESIHDEDRGPIVTVVLDDEDGARAVVIMSPDATRRFCALGMFAADLAEKLSREAEAEGSEELDAVRAYYEEEAELYDGVDGDEIIDDDMGEA